MTKRKRQTSAYTTPPAEDIRELMKSGWRRCDAERLSLVRTCVASVDLVQGRPELVPIAALAAGALAHEPTLAAAALHIAPTRGAADKLNRLVYAAPVGHRAALIRLWDLARAYEWYPDE